MLCKLVSNIDLNMLTLGQQTAKHHYTEMFCGAAVKADLNASRNKNGGSKTELRDKAALRTCSYCRRSICSHGHHLIAAARRVPPNRTFKGESTGKL